jgi:hypothetical protein
MKKNNPQQATDPIDKKEEVPQTKDKHINQDFPGYPHAPSEEKTINPKTKEDKANARLLKKENYKAEDTEQLSDGSANDFGGADPDLLRGELDDDNEKTY